MPAVLAGLILPGLLAAAQTAVPVVIGKADPDLDACLSTGQVSGINPRAREPWLNVRNRPGLDGRIVDRLQPDAVVTMCDSSRDDQWTGIVYSVDRDVDRGTGSPVPLPVPYRGPCKSGWVASRFLVVIAG